MIESLLLAVTRVTTMFGQQHLTNATGFFFARDDRLFLVTSRHVVLGTEDASVIPGLLRRRLVCAAWLWFVGPPGFEPGTKGL